MEILSTTLGKRGGYFPPKLSETGCRPGSAEPRVRPTPGCPLSRHLSSWTLPGGSPSGYMVVGGKFRQFPHVCGPLNPCASL
jgi:hypothetical protein